LFLPPKIKFISSRCHVISSIYKTYLWHLFKEKSENVFTYMYCQSGIHDKIIRDQNTTWRLWSSLKHNNLKASVPGHCFACFLKHLEGFSSKCHKTRSGVITLADHNSHWQTNKPIWQNSKEVPETRTKHGKTCKQFFSPWIKSVVMQNQTNCSWHSVEKLYVYQHSNTPFHSCLFSFALQCIWIWTANSGNSAVFARNGLTSKFKSNTLSCKWVKLTVKRAIRAIYKGQNKTVLSKAKNIIPFLTVFFLHHRLNLK